MPRFNRSAVLALSAALLAAPVLANPTPVRSGEVWRDIEALAADVDRADARDTISEREAAGLRGEIGELKAQYRRYNANGLSPAEARTLEGRINRLRTRLGNERRDPGNRQG